MPTTTFDIDDARIYQSGRFEYGYIGSQRALVFFGSNSQLDFTATGTDCSLLWAAIATGTNYLQVSVDGGAFTNLTPPASANTYTSTTLFTGLSDAAHAVTIRHAAGASSDNYLQVLGGLSVTGAAPALAVPPAASFGALYRGPGGEFLRYCLPEGNVGTDNSLGYYRVDLNTPDSAIRFRANPTAIQVWGYLGNNPSLRVSQDGVAIGAKTVLGGSLNYGWTTLATGLDGAVHDYVVSVVGATAAYLVGLNLIGGDLDKVTPVVQRPAALWVGDSITMGVGTADSSLAFPWLVSQAKGYQSINQGVSGVRVLETNTVSGSSERDNPVLYSPNVYPGLVKYVVVNSGHNDSAAANLGTSSSELRAAYVRLFTKLKRAYPEATLLAVSPFDTTAYTTAARDAIAADMSAAAAAVGGWTYVRGCSSAGNANFTDGFLTAAGDLADGTHPNAAGYVKIYTGLAPHFTTAPSLYGGGGGLFTNSFGGGML